MEKDKVYISGAIAHYNIDERKGAFLDAENRLRAMGFNPVNPFKNGLPDEAHWREHMRADIRLLLDCEYIYMLKDWELSKGAKLELDVASSCGIKVLFEKPLNCRIMNDIEKVFRGLGRTKKVEFVSENIEYASAHAVAEYVKGYLFDVLNDLGDDDYVASYLKDKGYEVTKKDTDK